jgi:predicted dehydrogenase
VERIGPDGAVNRVSPAEDDVYRAELLDFGRAVRGGPPPLTSGRDGVINTYWLNAAYGSARGKA